MRSIRIEKSATIGAEHLYRNLGSHWSFTDDLFLDFLIYHDRRIGHDWLALFVELRHVNHHSHAVRHDWFSLRVELWRLDHDRDVRCHWLALIIRLWNLDGVRLGQPGFGVRLEILDHPLRDKKDRV